VLNQGEFARFLLSSFSERKDILEKIHSSFSLEHLAAKTKDRWQKSGEEVHRYEIKLHELQGQSFIDPKLLEDEWKSTTTQLEKMETELQKQTEDLQLYQRLVEIAERITQLTLKIQEQETTLKNRHEAWSNASVTLNKTQQNFDLHQDLMAKKTPLLIQAQKDFQALRFQEETAVDLNRTLISILEKEEELIQKNKKIANKSIKKLSF
jgi:DNA repair exonuclease SbcCD ATPase subunit